MHSPSSPAHVTGAAFAACAAFLVACAAGDDANGFAVRDSAGVRIAENASAAWADGRAWRISTEPTVDIGVLDGAPEYQLFDIDDATRFPDGRIAIADGSNEVRIFDAGGGFVRALGGAGEGPGEFEDLSSVVALPGDSILAFDDDNGRVTVFGPTGEVVRTVTLRRVSPAPVGGFARLADGTFVVVVTGWSSQQLDPEESRQGITYREPSPVLRYGPDGALLDTIGSFPGLEIAIWEAAGGGRRMGIPYFGHGLATAVHGDRVYVGTQERFEISVYSPDGALRRLIRGPTVDLAITDADVARLREMLLEQAPADEPDAARELDERLGTTPRPERRAAYEWTVVDAAGNLWVGEADGWLASPPARWTVFDREGRMLGTVEVPDRFRVLEIGGDHIVGTWTDAYDVEHVRVYAITRPDGATDR